MCGYCRVAGAGVDVAVKATGNRVTVVDDDDNRIHDPAKDIKF